MARKALATESRYKIVGICQVYNELEKGNLMRFLQYVRPVVDELVMYDDGSTDGTFEYLLDQPVQLIRGSKNNFGHELAHKQQLLDKALTLKPDFILWLDADEVLTAGAERQLQHLCHECMQQDLDGISLREINLWRSATYERLDSLYGDGWYTRLWRVTNNLLYAEPGEGLHQILVPPSVERVAKSDRLAVLHYGFADQKNLAYKYLTYRAHGQRGYNMLDRFISEDQLELNKVPQKLFPPGLYQDESPPHTLLFAEGLASVESYREAVQRPRFSIACLVYKSVDWLQFVHEQVLKYTDMTNVEFFFVTNDAEQPVLDYLRDNYIPHHVWQNTAEHKKEWYINNVYRAYNFAAKQAKGDFLVFINSDMAFTPGWLDNLFAVYDGKNCVASRLVESGRLRSGTFGIEKNFGSTIDSFDEDGFQHYAAVAAKPTVEDGGLYMPLLMRKDHFQKIGGYPPGNATPDSGIHHPNIAKEGEQLISGDAILIQKMEQIGVRHVTAFDSIVYHFQQGEKSSSASIEEQADKHVAICNDLVTGSMGERVLWDFLLEGLPSSYGVDTRLVGSQGNFAKKASQYIETHHPQTTVLIQNATFIDLIDKARVTIAFLQDNLRAMGRPSVQQEKTIHLANRLVTNSYQVLMSYPEYDFTLLTVGSDETVFTPMDKQAVRRELEFGDERIGIFVGDFSETKGWSRVASCIKQFSDITWILVTKKDEAFESPNARVYSRIDQKLLAKLLNCADFFIIGSDVETQCLAAVEACLCDVPVVMQNVGVFRGFSEHERARAGIFGPDFAAAINLVPNHRFSPRQVILDKKLTVHDSVERWRQYLERVFQDVAIARVRGHNVPASSRTLQHLTFRAEFFYRRRILKPLFGQEQITLPEVLTRLRHRIGKFRAAQFAYHLIMDRRSKPKKAKS